MATAAERIAQRWDAGFSVLSGSGVIVKSQAGFLHILGDFLAYARKSFLNRVRVRVRPERAGRMFSLPM